MSFSAYAETSILKLIFNATNWANLADNTATSPLASLYLGLHSADPSAGSQATSEATYAGYARAAVARTTGGFSIVNNQATLVANCDFPAGTGGADTITEFSVGVASAGATQAITAGTVSPNITTGNGITPRLTTATTFTLN
jgi:hypothetical protein